MPQVTIPTSMDADFLAELAGLDNAWGVITTDGEEGTVRQLMFMTADLLDVDEALIAYPAAYLTYRKSQKLEELASHRKVYELLGPNGLTLDQTTIVRLNAAATGYIINPLLGSLQWEVTRGTFTELTKEAVFGLALNSMAQVQACFLNVYNKTQLIQAVELDEEAEDQYAALEAALAILDAIDLTADWPTPVDLGP